MSRSRLVTRDEAREPYEVVMAVGMAVDAFLLLALGFALGRCSMMF